MTPQDNTEQRIRELIEHWKKKNEVTIITTRPLGEIQPIDNLVALMMDLSQEMLERGRRDARLDQLYSEPLRTLPAQPKAPKRERYVESFMNSELRTDPTPKLKQGVTDEALERMASAARVGNDATGACRAIATEYYKLGYRAAQSSKPEWPSEILDTLTNADNEGTESPYWLLIDPAGRNIKTKIGEIASCITGPFFSREDAENYLKSRHYAYSSRAGVWCASGYYSKKYKEFYRGLKKVMSEK